MTHHTRVKVGQSPFIKAALGNFFKLLSNIILLLTIIGCTTVTGQISTPEEPVLSDEQRTQESDDGKSQSSESLVERDLEVPSESSMATATPTQRSQSETNEQPSTPGLSIGLYETLELVFEATETPTNPFDTYLLKLELNAPDGQTFTIDGFYDGDGSGGQSGNVWKARITPYMLGHWQWRTVPGDMTDDALVGQSGSFTAIPSAERGGLVSDGHYFRFQTGELIYLVGNFLDLTDGLRTTHTYMSETTTDAQRDAIIARHRDFHNANKANIYFANVGDYDNQSVTPWLGTAQNNDKTRMDLARWHLYDEYILRFKRNRMFAELWFFADDSNFGTLTEVEQDILLRYGMARTSAFNHTLYVIALEWQEAFSGAEVTRMGHFIQAHNPWQRPLSVHSRSLRPWAFADEDWPTFIATQVGNSAKPAAVNEYAIEIRQSDDLPHLHEEFGYLRRDVVQRLRSNLWANFCAGAAGSGTGSGLAALQQFLAQSRAPFQRMTPANEFIDDGGITRFLLAEPGHHYIAYSMEGAFELQVEGSDLQGYWFDPRATDPTLGDPFPVSAGSQLFTPPSPANADWVLWITDGSNLTNGITHPPGGGETPDLSHTQYLPFTRK